MLTGNQGAALLEFFRNLTPQILFAACALYMRVQLDFSTFNWTWKSIGLTFGFFACWALYLTSLMVNLSRFMGLFVSGNEQLDQAMEALRGQPGGIARKLPKVLAAVWTHNKRGLFEAILVVVFAYAGLVPVATMATHSAVGLLTAGR